jgi:CTP synthase
LDLGHYERFLNIPTSQANNVTTGKIYQTVINHEREGVFLGKTVQVIPHITNEIKRRMQALSLTGDYEIIITEIGGTVGDIESLPFIESIRQLKWELGSNNAIVVHLTLIPYLKAAKELKTKPTQHSVKDLLEIGVQPDILVCRTEDMSLNMELRRKLALFCNVTVNSVIEARDVKTIYDVPMEMLREKLDKIVLDKLNLVQTDEPDLEKWKAFLNRLKNPKKEVRIGLVGKYVELQDAYKSIHESFIHAGVSNDCKVIVESIHSEFLSEETINEKLSDLDGVLVAPGFGGRGVEGKIEAIRFIREKKIPFFGICFGMQCAAIEFARNVLHLNDAHSTEVNQQTPHPVIDIMEEQKEITQKGGTMRLGAYPCNLKEGSIAHQAYQAKSIKERHRHRYEFNNLYFEQFEKAGMIATGINPDKNLVEIIELLDHPYFIGVQFHPELKSTVENPHPLFVSFIKAAIAYQESKQ